MIRNFSPGGSSEWKLFVFDKIIEVNYFEILPIDVTFISKKAGIQPI